MIPELWNELGTEKIGDLNDCLECFVEEERNGIFELTLDYPNGYPLADQLLKERIIVVNANDTLFNQKFRIYDTKKFINETITVFARHISFDLMYDYVGDVTFENQSCEYALNSLFRQSQFSKHYRGYSDIVNAQNYSMSMCNILEAIGGKEGSIIDTFGTGAEILRDNTDIHVLNARGHDNGVTIEYGKNLTGFELSEDTTNLVTRILPYAKYTPEGGKETFVRGNFVDSPLINSYSHPYIKHIDYTDKFKDKEIPTKEKLETLARNEYRDSKVDIPKTNFKIEFIPLSKCVGYEELEDKISICDKVTIKNIRYNVDTKAKVIKYKFDVLKDRYESMELGEPRTTFGDIIGSGSGEGQVGPPGPPGPPGADGSIGDFPNSLPQVPVLTAKVYGFASIELSWTYEDKVYYTYEVYASKTKDFTPNTFDLIHAGQTSSYLFQTKPGETWYFRVCAKNTHNERTAFSPQVVVTTKKSDNFEDYFSSLGVGNLVANIFSADYMEAGIIKGHWIDAKNLSLTDGNGVRRLDINSFGRFYLEPSEFILNTSDTNVPTKKEVSSAVGVANSYTDTQVNIVTGQIREKVSQTDYNANNEVIRENILEISKKADGISQKVSNIEKWESSDVNTVLNSKLGNTSNEYGFAYRKVMLERGKTFTLTANGRVSQQALNDGKKLAVIIYNDDWTWNKTIYIDSLEDTTQSITFTAPDNGLHNIQSYMYPNGGSRAGSVTVNWYKNVLGNKPSLGWSPSPNDIDSKFNEQTTEIEQLSNEIKHKVDDKGVQSIITQSGSQVVNAFNSVNPNVQNDGKFIIKNGMFEIWNSQNARTMYISDGGLVASNTGFGTYKNDGSGLHMTGNVLLHVPPPSGDYEEFHIESNLPIKFKTGLWGSQQAVQYQRVITSGVMLDGTAWNPNGVQLYILSADAEGDTVVLYNQYKQLTMNLTARNIECQQLTVAGAKNRIVKTKNYGTRKLNAVESAECYFEDRGKGNLVNGRCRIDIDKIFSETVNLDDYDVSVTKYGRGDIWISERRDTYFIVEGENDIEFSYILYAKQKGYENERLTLHESDYKEISMVENQMFKENITYKELEQGNAWKLYRK